VLCWQFYIKSNLILLHSGRENFYHRIVVQSGTEYKMIVIDLVFAL